MIERHIRLGSVVPAVARALLPQAFTDPGRRDPGDPSFADIVDSLDREVLPANTEGVGWAFIDGSGSDCASEANLEEWHTFTIFFTLPELLLEERTAATWPRIRGRFLKWSGRIPGTENNASNLALAKYKTDISVGLADKGKPAPILLHSWSYQTKTLLAMKAELYAMFGLRPAPGRGASGYFNFTDPRGRTMVDIAGWMGYQTFTALEGNVLVILNMAQQVVLIKSVLDNIVKDPQGRKPKGIILVTDPLCGDSRDPTRARFGTLLYTVLNHAFRGEVNVRVSRDALTKIGEILVDNVAGCLNEGLKADPIGHFNNYSRRIWQGDKLNFAWRITEGTKETIHQNGTTRVLPRGGP